MQKETKSQGCFPKTSVLGKPQLTGLYCAVRHYYEQGIQVYTPVKLEKGRKCLGSAVSFFPRPASKARQATGPFFNWLNEKTRIQSASKVRSASGLIAFIFARLAVAALYP
jgi:hypothetical protein